MKNFFRWALVLPAAWAAMVMAFFVLRWASDSFVLRWAWVDSKDVAFSTFQIIYFSSMAGAYAGIYTASSRRHTLASVLAIMLVAGYFWPLHLSETAGTSTPVPTTGWTACASENGVCNFSGTRQVRYGVSGIYAFKTATSPIGCNNGVFGDPVPNSVKSCQYADVQSSPTAPALLPPGTLSTVQLVAGYFWPLNLSETVATSTFAGRSANSSTIRLF